MLTLRKISLSSALPLEVVSSRRLDHVARCENVACENDYLSSVNLVGGCWA